MRRAIVQIMAVAILAAAGAAGLLVYGSRMDQEKSKIASEPAPARDYLAESRAEGRAVVQEYIEQSSDDPEKQKKLARYYCSQFHPLPVKYAGLVQEEYAKPENCMNLGVPLLKRLAESNDLEAQLELASLFNRKLAGLSVVRPNDDESFKWYKRIAEHAPNSAMTSSFQPSSYKAIAAGWLSIFYKEGISVQKDLSSAFQWLSVSTSIRGDDSQRVELAEMLAKGEGTKADPIASEAILRSMPNSDDAQFKLGEILLFQDLTTGDRFLKARHIFETLHAKGQTRFLRHESAYYLGLLDLNSDPGNPDYRSAFRYSMEAARYGEPQAQGRVANFYLNGLGVVQDYQGAYLWSSLAAANGDAAAVTVRQESEKHLSASAIGDARKQALSWGKGGNSATYECRAGGANELTENFTIDLDTLTARWQYGRSDNLDVVEDGDEFILRRDYYDEEYTIDRKSGVYKVQEGQHTRVGTCRP